MLEKAACMKKLNIAQNRALFLLVLCLITAPAIAEAIEANALLSIYEKLNVRETCRQLGFSSCKFVIKDSDEENAYVTGDGNIYIYTRLLRNVTSEDELAFIIAHELGHLAYRHPKRRQEDVGWIALGNLITQIFVKNNDTKMLIDGVSSAITGSYTRKQEREADLYAIESLCNAGYDPLKAINFFYRCLDNWKRVKYEFDHQKAEIERELYQSDYNVKQLNAYLTQSSGNVKRAEQIYRQAASSSAYNQLVRLANYHNSLVAQYNHAVRYHNSRVDSYKEFAYEYTKALSPLFRTHPLDEERITTIINVTNGLMQQRRQRQSETGEGFRTSRPAW